MCGAICHAMTLLQSSNKFNNAETPSGRLVYSDPWAAAKSLCRMVKTAPWKRCVVSALRVDTFIFISFLALYWLHYAMHLQPPGYKEMWRLFGSFPSTKTWMQGFWRGKLWLFEEWNALKMLCEVQLLWASALAGDRDMWNVCMVHSCKTQPNELSVSEEKAEQ